MFGLINIVFAMYGSVAIFIGTNIFINRLDNSLAPVSIEIALPEKLNLISS
ncbi:MAG: hypothetical protein WDM90_05700 [Ferruginibacter sp.]